MVPISHVLTWAVLNMSTQGEMDDKREMRKDVTRERGRERRKEEKKERSCLASFT